MDGQEANRSGTRFKERPVVSGIARSLSFVPTPLLLIASPAVGLFLQNQRDLDFDPSVVGPFVLVAVAVWFLGTLLDRLRGVTRDTLVWAYYFAGPLYLVDANIALFASEASLVAIRVILAAVAIGILIALRRSGIPPDEGVQLLGVMGALLICYEVIRVANEFDPPRARRGANAEDSVIERESTTAPNIYHLLFDGLQGDVFERQLTSDARRRLGGFVLFPSTTAVFNQTVVSLPGSFTGLEYDYSTPLEEYQYAAFNSDASFLADLRRLGFRTTAYTRKFYAFELGLFDDVIQHIHNSVDAGSGQVARDFVELWAFATLPATLSSWFLSDEALESFERNTFLPYAAPIRSIESMNRIIESEGNFESNGRYTFIHLMFPHLPHVLREDCTYDVEASATTPEESYTCTLMVLERFLQRLDDLGRYDQSMIVVQGDHGGYLRLQDDELFEAQWRSPSTVLMVKPFGQSRDVPLKTSKIPTTTLDVAWLMRRAVRDAKESWLSDLGQVVADRQRYFHRAQKGGMFKKFLIGDGDPVEVGDVKYNRTPRKEVASPGSGARFRTDRVVEAEDGNLSGAVDIRSDQPGTSGHYVMSGNKSFTFEVDRPGRYVLRARVISPSGNNDSSYVTMAGRRSTWVFRIRDEWTWFEYGTSWQLDPGEHTITLGYREPIFLDQVQLASNTASPDVVLEAEAGFFEGPAKIGDDRPGASHQYVTGGRAEWTFLLDAKNAYRVRARVLRTAPEAVLNLWLEGDGGHPWPIGDASEWTWVTFDADWNPSDGKNRLRIEGQEGLLIDQLELVTHDLAAE